MADQLLRRKKCPLNAIHLLRIDLIQLKPMDFWHIRTTTTTTTTTTSQLISIVTMDGRVFHAPNLAQNVVDTHPHPHPPTKRERERERKTQDTHFDD